MEEKPNPGTENQQLPAPNEPNVPDFQPTNSTANSQTPYQAPSNRKQNLNKRPLLPRLVKIISITFWVPFALLAIIVSYLVYEAHHGVSGTEFIGLALAPFVLIEVLLGIVYTVLLVVYSFSKYPSRRQRFLSILAILILSTIFGWQIFASKQESNKINQSKKPLTDAEVINLIDNCKVESVQKNGGTVDLLLVNNAYYDSKGNYLWRSTSASSAHWDSFVAEIKKVNTHCGGNIAAIDNNTGPKESWVSAQQATVLLQQCQIKTFNYTPSGLENSPHLPAAGSTGIILQQYPTFSHLYIEQSEESTMIPIARSVQPKCGGPQFYHDNSYEQLQSDGTWR